MHQRLIKELRMRNLLLFAMIAMFTLIAAQGTAHGQPPPLGPKTYKSDATQLPVSTIISFVRATAQNAVDAANTQIHQQHKSISVQLTSVNTNTPYRTPTVLTDRPNQTYVDV